MKSYTKIINTILFSILCSMVFAQSGHEICGTIPTQEQIDYLDQTKEARQSFSYDIQERQLIRIPIVNHIVRQSDGTGGLTTTQLADALQNMNDFYAATDIEFFECEPAQYIDNSTWYDFKSTDEGAVRNFSNVTNTLNIYHFNTVELGGNDVCGYTSLPPGPDRIMIKNSCTTNGATLIHEVGHYLSLYHTHGKSNCGTTDELVDGSNCTTAGDDVCDTPADPNLYQNCNTVLIDISCTYIGTLTDANGQFYTPMVNNIMAYSYNFCRNQFTQGQFDRVRFSALNDRNYLLCSDYCTPTINLNPNPLYITNVTLEQINNNSGNGGYENFTNHTATLSQSGTYTLSISKPTSNFSLIWRAWIDFNGDGDFDDANELVFDIGNSTNDTVTQSFTVPANANLGSTGMRVSVKSYDPNVAPPTPCENIPSGETEDYTINIVNTACTDADSDGVCAADDCNDNDASIPTSPGTACDDGNANTANDVIQADGCTCQGTVIPPTPSNYCIPNVTSDANNYISGIVLGASLISQSSGNDGGYRDFTTEVAPANIFSGQTYTMSLYKLLDNDVNQYWRVWIDYNQDGVFDDNTELIASQWPVSDNQYVTSFTVPAGTPNGTTRMRVYLKDYVGQPPTSCGNNDNVRADVEDYAIIIGDDCQPFYELSGTINTNVFKAQDYIESDGQVPAGNNVTFQAGNIVHLLPGFTAKADVTSKFHALIQACTANSPDITDVAFDVDTPIVRNYPNPFTGQTTIEYVLSEDTPVTLSVLDATGRKMEVLLNHEVKTQGIHKVTFNGNNYPAGIYYYIIQVGEYVGTQKMVLVK